MVELDELEFAEHPNDFETRSQDAEGEDEDGFEAAAVELDESLLNLRATGVDGLVTGNSQFYSRMGPKKAFSLLKFKKKL